MIYFDSDKRMVKVPVLERISHPYNSHYVYRTTDGRCLKVYRIYGVGPDIVIDKKIQNLQLDNFYQVDQFLFDRKGVYSAMLMPFYEACSADVLLKPSDYLADNFSAIFNSFDTLGMEGIETRDANYENMIFTDNEIIIIDSERYLQSFNDEIAGIRRSNYMDACWLLYLTLINSSSKHDEFRDSNFSDYFSRIRPNGRGLCRVLSKYKYPIDYMREIKKNV